MIKNILIILVSNNYFCKMYKNRASILIKNSFIQDNWFCGPHSW